MGKWPYNEINDEARRHRGIIREMADQDDGRGFWVVTMPGYCWSELGRHTTYVRSVQELRLALYSVRTCTCSRCSSQGDPAIIARQILGNASAKQTLPPSPQEVFSSLRGQLTWILYWIEGEMAGSEIDPQHPAWYEAMLSRLRDTINHRLSQHTWSPYARDANEGVILDGSQPAQPGPDDSPDKE